MKNLNIVKMKMNENKSKINDLYVKNLINENVKDFEIVKKIGMNLETPLSSMMLR